MTMRVRFNGKVLVQPGGASKTDASLFGDVSLGEGIVGVVGEAECGQPQIAIAFNTPEDMKAYFRSGPLYDAADLLFTPMKDTRVPGGAASVIAVKANASLAAAKTFKKGVNDVVVVTAIQYGFPGNKITVTIDAGSTAGVKLTIVYSDSLIQRQETSPDNLGGTAEFVLKYTGAGSAATATLGSNGLLSINVTGAGVGEPAITNLDVSQFSNLNEFANYMKQTGIYTVTFNAGINPYELKPTDLDWVTALDVKTGAGGSFFAGWTRMVNWVNANSQLITMAAPNAPAARAQPDTSSTAYALTGGARGVSANSDWQSALDLLKKVRVDAVVPLIEVDASADTFYKYGGTATVAAVLGYADQHSQVMSDTGGNSERQTYAGFYGTKAAIINQAQMLLNSLHTSLFCQRPTVLTKDGLKQLPAWALACIAAGARAGSDPGEPLTFKYLRIFDIAQDSSWSPDSTDTDDLILAGVNVVRKNPGKGFRFVKVITTYTRDDNDAYTEESVVTGWKSMQYELREYIIDQMTGRRLLPSNAAAIKALAIKKLEEFRTEGRIVNSTLDDGTVVNAWRKLKISSSKDTASLTVETSPVEGLNFLLVTNNIVPAQQAA